MFIVYIYYLHICILATFWSINIRIVDSLLYYTELPNENLVINNFVVFLMHFCDLSLRDFDNYFPQKLIKKSMVSYRRSSSDTNNYIQETARAWVRNRRRREHVIIPQTWHKTKACLPVAGPWGAGYVFHWLGSHMRAHHSITSLQHHQITSIIAVLLLLIVVADMMHEDSQSGLSDHS